MLDYLKRVFREISRNRAGQLSAAFAYIAIFSIGPFLLIFISVIGFIFGEKAAQGQLFNQFSSVMGPQTAKSLQDVIANSNGAGKGVIALIAGVLGTLLGAIGLTSQLQSSFDIVFDAVPDPDSGIKKTIYTKFKNMFLLFFGSLAVAASVIVSAIISGVGRRIIDLVGIPAAGLELLNTAASLLVFVTVLYLIYKVLPGVVIPRKIVLLASFIISLLFIIGKIILAIVIGKNATAGAYGAAAAVIVLMLWFYYTAQILILGAAGIKVYCEIKNVTILPKRFYVRQKRLDVSAKKDLLGRTLTAFARGFKNKSSS